MDSVDLVAVAKKNAAYACLAAVEKELTPVLEQAGILGQQRNLDLHTPKPITGQGLG